jgi:hypothetical protein
MLSATQTNVPELEKDLDSEETSLGISSESSQNQPACPAYNSQGKPKDHIIAEDE